MWFRELIRRFTEIILFGNIWISLGAVAFTLHSYLVAGWELNLQYLWLVFFATLASYNFQRIVRLSKKKDSERHLWIANSRLLLLVMIAVSLIVSSILFFRIFQLIDLLYVSPLLLIGFFYALAPQKGKKPLRDLPFIKILLIAISWVVVVVMLPAYLQVSISETTWKLSIITLCYIIGLTIPFDIRDLEYDEKDKKTIPQLLGVKKSIYVSIFLIGIAAFLHLLWFREFWIVEILYLLSIVVVSLTNKKRSELFFVFFIDGLLILFPLFSIAQKYIWI